MRAKISIIWALAAVMQISLSYADEPLKTSYLRVPGGAIFKKSHTLKIAAGENLFLSDDTHFQIDTLIIEGTLYTRGHLLSAFIGKLIFGPNGKIATFDASAPASTVLLSPPPTPLPAGDQPRSCERGDAGQPGNRGHNAVKDDSTDGLKNPQAIQIFAAEVEGIVKIEGFGQDGGQGTQGGVGGQGGQGGRGGPADADGGFLGATSDTCGGGPGGDGGVGGKGGAGGPGGDGGPAPTVKFQAANIRTPQTLADNIILREGLAGAGGKGGPGGAGGLPGAGGINDSAGPIFGGGFTGNEEDGGLKGLNGLPSTETGAAGEAGKAGPVPALSDRKLFVFSKLEGERLGLFKLWQEFHWRRQLVAHVQDSFRVVQNQITTREYFQKNLEAKSLDLNKINKKYLARVIDAWNKAFIAPLEATVATEVADSRMQEGLKIGHEVTAMLAQLSQETADSTQVQLDALLNSDQGLMITNQKQLQTVTESCATYNADRADQAPEFPVIGLYFRIPSCEGEPDFTKKGNLSQDVVLAEEFETDIQPKSFQDSLLEKKFLISFLPPDRSWNAWMSQMFMHLLSWALPSAVADEKPEHPLLAIELVPFSVATVELGGTENRDEKELGQLVRLQMKDEKEIFATNFYQELRALAVMTGAKQ